jgi:energy-coupling factor transport system substrate-specific component
MTAFDRIAEDLQVRRTDAGSPSYAEIALRIARIREQRGGPDATARPARTTVYDAFRTGRRRLDTALVLDIVRALGADEEEVAGWADRCRTARLAEAFPPRAEDPAAAPSSTPPPPPPPPASTPPAPGTPPPPVTAKAGLLVALGCIAVNMVGRVLVVVIPEIPLYVDMVGTAVAAVILGPWWGAGVGLSTNLLGTIVSGPESIPFAIVNVAGALVWGYGVRRWRMGRTLPRFFALNCLVAIVCTSLAVPIIVARGGETGNGADDVIDAIQETVESLWLAVASANILTSLADKTISGFVALLAVDVLPRRVTAPVRPLMPLAAAPERASVRSGP